MIARYDCECTQADTVKTERTRGMSEPISTKDMVDELLFREEAGEFGDLLYARFKAGEDEYGAGNIDKPWVDTAMEELEELADTVIYRLSQQVNGDGASDESVAAAIDELRKFKERQPHTEKPLKVFVSGPYTADMQMQTLLNIGAAKLASQAIMARGNYVHCPHTMTAHWENSCPTIQHGEYVDMCVSVIEDWADAIFMLPGWCGSKGANIEHDAAVSLGIPVYSGHILQVPFCWPTLDERWKQQAADAA